MSKQIIKICGTCRYWNTPHKHEPEICKKCNRGYYRNRERLFWTERDKAEKVG